MREWTDKVKESIQSIIVMFESGKLPEAISKTVIHRLKNDTPSAQWSLGNQLLMLLAGTTDLADVEKVLDLTLNAESTRQYEKV